MTIYAVETLAAGATEWIGVAPVVPFTAETAVDAAREAIADAFDGALARVRRTVDGAAWETWRTYRVGADGIVRRV